MTLPDFTLGIEEEFQIIDPESGELRSHVSQLMKQSEVALAEKVSRELHQSVIEIGSKVCANIQEARQEVTAIRAALCRIARENGLRVGAAGTHPFTHWSEVSTTENERYNKILDDLQVVARANVIFGLHVHVGIEDRDTLIHIFNMARYFVPHMMALAVNSPFWCGRDTGWKSYRTKIFEKFPRTGIPNTFRSYREFDELIGDLLQTNSIDSGKMLWWELRPHHRFPTLEFRCCDVQMRVDETICLAAMFQALVAKLYRLHQRNLSFRLHRRTLIEENRWRAARWGVSGNLIDLGKMREVPTADLMGELLEFVEEVVDELGVREELGYVHQILEEGTGADRQLEVWNRNQDFKELVNYIADETERGLPMDCASGD
ncbi:MAG: carboxylate-amine ligase [Planctomycetota bacterium]